MTEDTLEMVLGGVGPNTSSIPASNQTYLGGRVVALLCKGFDCFIQRKFLSFSPMPRADKLDSPAVLNVVSEGYCFFVAFCFGAQ